ncbi:MAG: PD40 domain-containing protein [Phycisphaerae bacterium]|nr:PD40 domain-containing protein [Phycisphaerae bacterium]
MSWRTKALMVAGAALGVALLVLLGLGADRPLALWSDGRTIRIPQPERDPRRILWTPAAPVRELGAQGSDSYEPRLSPDGVTMVFVRRRPGSNADLFASRWSPSGWTEPEALDGVNSDADELGPEFAPDGGSIYFYSDRSGGLGGYDLWVASRRGDGWGGAVNLGPGANSPANEYGPALAPDGKSLYFSSNRLRSGETPSGSPAWSATLRESRTRHDFDLYVATLTDGMPVHSEPLDLLNTAFDEGSPALSPIGDFLYFGSDRPGGLGGFDLYRVRLPPPGRVDESGVSGVEHLDASVNSTANDLDPALGADGFRLYFSTDRTNHRTDQAIEPARYELWSSSSREVYTERERAGPALADLWRATWPWLALLALLLVLGLLSWRLRGNELWNRRMRQLSLLARCLLVSLLIHAVLATLLAAWKVGSAVGEYLRAGTGGGTRVMLSSAGASDPLTELIRAGSTELAETQTARLAALRASPEPVRWEVPALDLPAPASTHQPEVLQQRSVSAPLAAIETRSPVMLATSLDRDSTEEPAGLPAETASAPPSDEAGMTVHSPPRLLPDRGPDASSRAAQPSEGPAAPPRPATIEQPSSRPTVQPRAGPTRDQIQVSLPPEALPMTENNGGLPPLPAAGTEVAEPASTIEPSDATIAAVPLGAWRARTTPRESELPRSLSDGEFIPPPKLKANPEAPRANVERGTGDGSRLSPASSMIKDTPARGLAAAGTPEGIPAGDAGIEDRLPELPPEPAEPIERFEQRAPELRDEVLEQMGGSARTEGAVRLALGWLARHQSADGRWSARSFDERCDCGGQAEADADVAMTGLSLLCYLGAGHTHVRDGPYRETVAKSIDWLVAGQGRDGDLRRGETMYSHSIATVALCEALAMSPDARLTDAARRALDLVLSRASVPAPRGAQRAEDVSSLGWQVMAIESARRAGLAIPPRAFAAVSSYLDRAASPGRPGLYSYAAKQAPSPAMTAEAMFVRQLLGHPRTESRMEESAAFVLSQPPRWRDGAPTHHWYYATLALFEHQGEAWREWNEALVPELLAHQRRDAHAEGSWDPKDQWSRLGGRIYQTAICTLSLEVYYRYRPAGTVGSER